MGCAASSVSAPPKKALSESAAGRRSSPCVVASSPDGSTRVDPSMSPNFNGSIDSASASNSTRMNSPRRRRFHSVVLESPVQESISPPQQRLPPSGGHAMVEMMPSSPAVAAGIEPVPVPATSGLPSIMALHGDLPQPLGFGLTVPMLHPDASSRNTTSSGSFSSGSSGPVVAYDPTSPLHGLARAGSPTRSRRANLELASPSPFMAHSDSSGTLSSNSGSGRRLRRRHGEGASRGAPPPTVSPIQEFVNPRLSPERGTPRAQLRSQLALPDCCSFADQQSRSNDDDERSNSGTPTSPLLSTHGSNGSLLLFGSAVASAWENPTVDGGREPRSEQQLLMLSIDEKDAVIDFTISAQQPQPQQRSEEELTRTTSATGTDALSTVLSHDESSSGSNLCNPAVGADGSLPVRPMGNQTWGSGSSGNLGIKRGPLEYSGSGPSLRSPAVSFSVKPDATRLSHSQSLALPRTSPRIPSPNRELNLGHGV